MIYSFGDIVIVNMPYSNFRDAKVRPALVLLQSPDNDVLLARISSQQPITAFDFNISDWRKLNLAKPSVVRFDKITNIDSVNIKRQIGFLDQTQKQDIRNFLSAMFLRL